MNLLKSMELSSASDLRWRTIATLVFLLLGLGVITWTLIELAKPSDYVPVVRKDSGQKQLQSAADQREDAPEPQAVVPKEMFAPAKTPTPSTPKATPAGSKSAKKPTIDLKVIRGGQLNGENIGTFRLATYETTVKQYKACVDAGECKEPSTSANSCNWGVQGREKHPINCVSYDHAEEFCEWMGLRIPTEWEWQWAAQGREQARPFPWGTSPSPECARVVMKGKDRQCAQDSTMPVGSRPRGASRDGVMDLSGNVWEWTSSEFNQGSSRMSLRGGSWRHAQLGMFSTTKRAPINPRSSKHDDGGFRCAM